MKKKKRMMRNRERRTPWSDLDLERWREYDPGLTDSLWLFEEAVGGSKLDGQVVERLLVRYTRKDEVVLDLFLGSGTTLFKALEMGRRCIGVELKRELVAKVEEELGAGKRAAQPAGRGYVLPGDSTRRETAEQVSGVLEEMGLKYAHFLLLHPPYYGVGKAAHPADLTAGGDVFDYLDRFELAARRGFDLLEPGRLAGLVMGDFYNKSELLPMGSLCTERMVRSGFKVKCVNVKNIADPPEAEDGLRRYRALVGGWSVFRHEYVNVFFKPRGGGRAKYWRG